MWFLPRWGAVPRAAHGAKWPLDLLVPPEAALSRAKAVGLAMAALLAANPVVAQQAFFTAVSDLPLMPGLVEAAEAALVFDNPAGRIVELAATGAVAESAVRDFYAETLPQLGWEPAGDGRYVREGELLTLAVEAGEGGLIVRFSIAPRDGPAP